MAAYSVASDSKTTEEEKALPLRIAFGIDFGTSQCTVAACNGSEVKILSNTMNQQVLKSYLSYEATSGSVKAHQPSFDIDMSAKTIFNIKRLIGRVDDDPVIHASENLPFLVQILDVGVLPSVAALVNNVWRFTDPEYVLSLFLVVLRHKYESFLNQPIKNAVVTVPVSFNRFQLTLLKRACLNAGLNVLKLMPEPTAVALLYGQQQQKASHETMGSRCEKIALVFNMGAGFCDVAVTATPGGHSEIKALAGSTVGGEDLLQNMMRYLLPDFENIFKDHGVNEIKSMTLLREATQDAIHQLSSQTSVQVDVDLGDGLKICKVVDRAEFEEVNREVFEKCENLIIQCLHDARVEVEEVNDVIIVGGCSCIPRVNSLVTNIFKGKELYKGINPLEAAVCGAALLGAITSGIGVPFANFNFLRMQVTPLSIGIRGGGDKFVPIIPRNTTTPIVRGQTFTTIKDNQTEALIVVYEGEGEKVELGHFKVSGIPEAPKGVPKIEISMEINSGNILIVSVAVPLLHVIQVKMPMFDSEHAWSAEALNRICGDTMDLVTPKKT